MANVPETPSFDAGIYQIETTDPVLGGPNGIANAQAKGLANRTAFLKQQIDQLNSGQFKPSWIASTDYVQGELQKLDAKAGVRAATVANITLSGAQTIDGVVLSVGDRVLVKNQTSAAQNGIYLVAAQGWNRAPDADNGAKLTSGARVAVEEGDINAGKVWYLVTTGAISIGSTQLLFKDEHPAASEGVDGTIKVATQYQVDVGDDDGVAVTPKKMRFGFAALLNTVGYIAFPTWLGGFIIQWGSISVPINSTATATLPVTFPNGPLQAVCSYDNTSGTIYPTSAISLASNSSVTIGVKASGGNNFIMRFLVVGR